MVVDGLSPANGEGDSEAMKGDGMCAGEAGVYADAVGFRGRGMVVDGAGAMTKRVDGQVMGKFMQQGGMLVSDGVTMAVVEGDSGAMKGTEVCADEAGMCAGGIGLRSKGVDRLVAAGVGGDDMVVVGMDAGSVLAVGMAAPRSASMGVSGKLGKGVVLAAGGSTLKMLEMDAGGVVSKGGDNLGILAVGKQAPKNLELVRGFATRMAVGRLAPKSWEVAEGYAVVGPIIGEGCRNGEGVTGQGNSRGMQDYLLAAGGDLIGGCVADVGAGAEGGVAGNRAGAEGVLTARGLDAGFAPIGGESCMRVMQLDGVVGKGSGQDRQPGLVAIGVELVGGGIAGEGMSARGVEMLGVGLWWMQGVRQALVWLPVSLKAL